MILFKTFNIIQIHFIYIINKTYINPLQLINYK